MNKVPLSGQGLEAFKARFGRLHDSLVACIRYDSTDIEKDEMNYRFPERVHFVLWANDVTQPLLYHIDTRYIIRYERVYLYIMIDEIHHLIIRKRRDREIIVNFKFDVAVFDDEIFVAQNAPANDNEVLTREDFGEMDPKSSVSLSGKRGYWSVLDSPKIPNTSEW